MSDKEETNEVKKSNRSKSSKSSSRKGTSSSGKGSSSSRSKSSSGKSKSSKSGSSKSSSSRKSSSKSKSSSSKSSSSSRKSSSKSKSSSGKSSKSKSSSSKKSSHHKSSRSSRRHGDKKKDESRKKHRGGSTSAKQNDKNGNQNEINESGENGEAVPKMQVKESGGVISASIEETNRIRIELGLKPLDVGPSKEEVERQQREAEEKARKEKEEEEMRKRFVKLREKQLNEKRTAGVSIGDQFRDKGSESALDWVQKMRDANKLKDSQLPDARDKAREIASRFEEMDDDEDMEDAPVPSQQGRNGRRGDIGSDRFTGYVAHNIGDFKSGDMVIAHVEDVPILNDANEENESEDRIVVPEMLEKDKQRLRDDISVARPGYTPYDGEEKSLTSYDSETWTGKLKTKSLKLDDFGSADKLKQIEEEEGAFQTKGKSEYSLETRRVLPSEYMTEEEMKAMKTMKFKKKKKKKDKKKKGKIRKKPQSVQYGDDVPIELREEMEAKSKKESKKNLEFLKTMSKRTNEESDHGSRSRNSMKDRHDRAHQQLLATHERYSNATASPKSKNSSSDQLDATVKLEEEQGRPTSSGDILAERENEERQNAALRRATRRDISMMVMDDDEEEDDAELFRVLESARIKELEKKKGVQPSIVDQVERISNMKKKMKEEKDDAGGEQLVFTGASDFTSGLQGFDPDAVSDDDAPAVVDTGHGTTLRPSASTSSSSSNVLGEGRGGGTWKEVSIEEEDEEPTDGKDGKDGKDESNPSYLGKEPLASGGMAEVLKLVKRRGLIDNDIATDFAGRANDERPRWLTQFKTYHPDIQLTYEDEYGRPMTRKEAFRKLSHRFHGKGPGKAKQEKRMKELHQQRRLKGESSVDTPHGTLSKLQNSIKQTGQAFVVLDGGKGGMLNQFEGLRDGGSSIAPMSSRDNVNGSQNNSSGSKRKRGGDDDFDGSLKKRKA